MENTLPFREKFERTLRRHLRLVAADEPIPYEANLVSVGLDSLGTINLLLDIEETFNVSLPGALLTPETFRTRATLESVVASLVEGA
jgi:acyl carrier protein